METKLISVVIDKELYKRVKKWCYGEERTIKEFVSNALHTELELQGANNGKKSTK